MLPARACRPAHSIRARLRSAQALHLAGGSDQSTAAARPSTTARCLRAVQAVAARARAVRVGARSTARRDAGRRSAASARARRASASMPAGAAEVRRLAPTLPTSGSRQGRRWRSEPRPPSAHCAKRRCRRRSYYRAARLPAVELRGSRSRHRPCSAQCSSCQNAEPAGMTILARVPARPERCASWRDQQ